MGVNALSYRFAISEVLGALAAAVLLLLSRLKYILSCNLGLVQWRPHLLITEKSILKKHIIKLYD